nr:BON domain-containing protein [Streptomyces sp. CB03234]
MPAPGQGSNGSVPGPLGPLLPCSERPGRWRVPRRDLLRVFLRTDEEIRSDVSEAFSVRVPAHDADQVRVDVRDGVVTMAGRLGPHADTSALIRAAWRVDGVVGVVNRLANGRGVDHARSDRP